MREAGGARGCAPPAGRPRRARRHSMRSGGRRRACVRLGRARASPTTIFARPSIRCVWSFRHHSTRKDWHFPLKLPKNGAGIAKRIAPGEGAVLGRVHGEVQPEALVLLEVGLPRGHWQTRHSPAARLFFFLLRCSIYYLGSTSITRSGRQCNAMQWTISREQWATSAQRMSQPWARRQASAPQLAQPPRAGAASTGARGRPPT